MKHFRIVFTDTVSNTSITVDDLLSLNFSCLDRGNVDDTINWSSYCNRGDCSFISDNDKMFWIKKMKKSNSKIISEIYLCIDEYTKKLACFNAKISNYDDETRECDFELEDVLLSTDDLNFDKIKYKTTWNHTLQDILTHAVTMDGGEMIFNPKIPLETYDDSWLSSFTVPIVDIDNSSSLRSLIDKISYASLSRAFTNENGKLQFSNDFEQNNGSPIIINPQNIISIIEKKEKFTPNFLIKFPSFLFESNYYSDTPIMNGGTFTVFSEDDQSFSSSGSLTSERVYGEYLMTLQSIAVWGYINLDAGFKIIDFDSDKLFIEVRYLADTTQQNVPNKIYTDFLKEDEYEIRKVKQEDDESFYVSFDIKNKIGSNSIKNENGYYETHFILNGSVSLIGSAYKGSDVFEKRKISIIGDDKLYVIECNDLMQIIKNRLSTDDRVYSVDIDSIKYAERISSLIYDKYSKSLEFFVIETLFSEYYDESKTLHKSINRYDIVSPYIFQNGFIQPLSTNESGFPKTFRVIGIEYLYDGLPRQKLHLQEYGTTTNTTRFWIDNVEFGFTEGMTWKQWLISSYNYLGYYASEKSYENGVELPRYILIDKEGTTYYIEQEQLSDKILRDKNYVTDTYSTYKLQNDIF